MSVFDPAAITLASVLVSLVTLCVLLLSPTAPGQRASVRLWVLGDCMSIAARVAALARPGVPVLGRLPELDPHEAEIGNGAIFVTMALLHGLALRSTLARAASRRSVALALAALPLLLVLLSALPHESLLAASLLASLGCSAWTAAIALPWRHQFRGALLVAVSTGLFALMAAGALAHLAWAGGAAAPQAPPGTLLMMDMVLSLTVTMGFLMTQFELLHQRIRHLSDTDALTGALNRRGFMQQLEAAAGRGPLALAMFDLDHFKRVNDTLGHPCGDAVLSGFVQRLRELTRATDVLGRWGGEEFVLLMPATDGQAARRIAERARTGVGAAPLADGAPVVTVSAGIATWDGTPAAGWSEPLLARADASLYRAKRQRDCVVLWGEDSANDALAADPMPSPRRHDGSAPAAC